jgi:hypothetical protein
MQADFSVELGRDDPALELPWSSADPSVKYYDLKANPDLILQIPEAVAYPPLGAFLARINMPGFPLATAKCDVWLSDDILPEEEIFGADRKIVSYLDLVFVDEKACHSFEKHEALAKKLCRLLSHAPNLAATVELIIRRCYFQQANVDASVARNVPDARNLFNSSHVPLIPSTTFNVLHGIDAPDTSTAGFYFTAYVTGFGDKNCEPVRQWEIALALLQHAFVQWSASRIPEH